jgi:hypothetical protein
MSASVQIPFPSSFTFLMKILEGLLRQAEALSRIARSSVPAQSCQVMKITGFASLRQAAVPEAQTR